MTRNSQIFLTMVMVSSLGQIMADMYLPSMPAIARGLHANPEAAQLSLSIFMFGYATSILIYGPVSDGVGRRNPLLTGLLLCLIGSLVCFTAPSIHVFNIGRLIQGFGAGATLSISTPILRDLFEGETLAKYSSYSALIGVGFLILAPLFGAYLQQYFDWRASFFVLTMYTLIALIAIFFMVPETNKHKHALHLSFNNIRINLVTVFSSPIFIGYCACSLLAYGALLAWLTAGPVILQSVVGLTAVGFGWVYALTGIGFAAGALINAKFVTHFGINRMMDFGFRCIFIAGLCMMIFALSGAINIFGIVPAAVLLLFGSSMVFPNTSAGLFHHFPQIAGITSALFYSSRMLSGSIFSGVIALLPDKDQLPLGVTCMLVALFAWLVAGITLNRLERVT